MNKFNIKTVAPALILGWALATPAHSQTYTLRVAEQQNCTVSVSPQKDSYSAGDKITATITPGAGAIFKDFQVYYQCTEEQWWAAQSAFVAGRTVATRRASGFSYRLEIWRIEGHEDEPEAVTEGTEYTFFMPADNVEIEAKYLSGSDQYDITKASAVNGIVGTDMNKTPAGQTVTITATPSSGYMVDEVKVYKREEGIYDTEIGFSRTGAGSFTFTMPANPVRIQVTFRAEPDVFELDEGTGITAYMAYDIQGKAARFKRLFRKKVASTVCLPFPIQDISGGDLYAFHDVKYEDGEGWVATMYDVTPEGGSPHDVNLVTPPAKADKPYLFLPAADGEVTFSGTVADDFTAKADTCISVLQDGTWTFHGTYSRLTYGTAPFEGSVFGFASIAKDEDSNDADAVKAGEFVKAIEGAGVPPFRAYLTYSGSDDTFRAPSRGGAGAPGIPDRITVRLVGKNGTVTAVGTINATTGEATIGQWIDTGGHLMQDTPTEPGIYLNGQGKKYLVK